MTDEPEGVPAPDPVPDPAPDPVPDPASETVPPAPPAPPARSRRGPALLAVAAVVAVAAGGGIGYAVLRHDDRGTAAKSAATPWTPPAPTATKAFGAKSGGTHYGSLSRLLLPLPADYQPGPDVDAYGNDVRLDAQQASALFKDKFAGMSRKSRTAAEKTVDELHIEGAGLRTYLSPEHLVVRIQIVQVRNKAAARSGPAYFRALTKAFGVYRNGPRIKGHDNAICVLPPIEPGEKLDMMLCQATEGDLMVSFEVSGTLPLHKTLAADLLARQLDRIQDPGEAV